MIRLILIILLLQPVILAAQRLEVSVATEKTALGSAISGRLGISHFYKVQGGVFFQRGRNQGPTEFEFRAYDFAGGYLHVPIAASDKVGCGFALYAGLVNNSFFVVTPAFETRIKIFQSTAFSVACGYRYGYPSVSAGLVYQFIK